MSDDEAKHHVQHVPKATAGFTARRRRSALEQYVVVARDDNLLPVRQRVEPVELGLQLGEGAADGEVAGVEEQVAVGHVGLCVVRVGYADDGYGVGYGVVKRSVRIEAMCDERGRFAEAPPW